MKKKNLYNKIIKLKTHTPCHNIYDVLYDTAFIFDIR